MEQARRELVRRRPMDEGNRYLLGRLKGIAGTDGYIEPDDILKLGTHVSTFNSNVERHLVRAGSREPPGKTSGRWAGRGVLLFVGAIVSIIAGRQPAVERPGADRGRRSRRARWSCS